MQLVVDGSYNGLELPEGWSCLITSNPAGGEYNVIELDPAQSSRMLVMGYTRPVEVFHEQCELQDVHEDMKSFWAAHSDLLEVQPIDIPKPDNNDRTKMIWNRIYPYMTNDTAVLKMVGATMFGPGFVSTLLSSLQTEQPLSPTDILYRWEDVSEKFKEYVDSFRTDLVSATTVRLIAWLDTQDIGNLEDIVFSNLAHFGQALPSSDAHNLIQRLCGFNGYDNSRGAKISARMKTTKDENGSIVPRREPHMLEFTNKMREIILSINTKLNAV
jgi:hypothetical protein